MRRTLLAILTVAVLIGAGFLLWQQAFQTTTYRYRLIVEVNVGDAVRVGSSVVEVSINQQPPLGEVPPYEIQIRGQAVYVDLGNGRSLFAVVKGGRSYEEKAFPAEAVSFAFGVPFDKSNFSRFADLKGKRALSRKYYPAFATFADLRTASSVQQVRPEDFSQVFGADVSLRSVSVEITSDPVSTGIEQVLPWLSPGDPMPIVMPNSPFDAFSFRRSEFRRQP